MRLLPLVKGLLAVGRDLSCVKYPVLLMNDCGSHPGFCITSVISATIHVAYLR